MIDFIKKLFSQEGKEKDPICGMMVEVKNAKFKSMYKNNTYFFCSEHCKKQFDESPSEYVN